MNRSLRKGDLVIATLPQQIPSMHEQQGTRPVVVVGVFPTPTRYLLVVVVPLTTQKGKWFDMNPIVYPSLITGTGNLKQDSVVLLDQVRTIDARRLLKYIGRLSAEEFAPIASGIAQIFM